MINLSALLLTGCKSISGGYNKYGECSLPGNLIQAVEKFEQSEVLRRALGDHIFKNFIRRYREDICGWFRYLPLTPLNWSL